MEDFGRRHKLRRSRWRILGGDINYTGPVSSSGKPGNVVKAEKGFQSEEKIRSTGSVRLGLLLGPFRRIGWGARVDNTACMLHAHLQKIQPIADVVLVADLEMVAQKRFDSLWTAIPKGARGCVPL